MPNVNLSPLDAQQAALNRRRALALALQQQSMEPIASPPVRGAQISPVEGIAKLAQALVGNLSNRRLDKEQSALSDQQQQQRESQAGSLVASLTPPAQGDVVQPDNSGLPLPQLGPQPQQLNPAPQQLDARTQSIKALAAALASQDPMMQKSGEAGLQNLMVSGRDSATQQQEMARLLAGQKFTGSQNDLNRGLTQQQIDIQRQVANQKDNTPVVVPADSSVYDRTNGTFNQAPKTVIPRPEPQPTEFDKKVEDFNRQTDLVAKFGSGPTGYEKWLKSVPQASSSTGVPQTVVIQTTDDNGNKVTKIVPKVAGSEFRAAPTAQEQNRQAQADIVERQVDHIVKLIDASPNAVGPILGRLAKGETVVGTVSPEAKALATALGSLVALQPILHGYRGGGQTSDHFTSIIGDQHLNAAALKASLAEIRGLAADIRKGNFEEPASGAKTPDIGATLDKLFGPAPKAK